MNCQAFEREWSGLEDSSRLPGGLEEHRRLCSACSELVEDLNTITQQARQMWTLEQPPDRVWHQIRHQLEQEGVIRDPARRWFPAPVPAGGWFFRWPLGLAYAAVFIVAVGVMYLHSLLSNPSTPPVLAVIPQVPEMALDRPRSPEREKSLQELAEKVPLEHRATFVVNWNQVSSSIEQLSNFLETHPEDPFARAQLRTAFQQREHLWETLVRWEEF